MTENHRILVRDKYGSLEERVYGSCLTSVSRTEGPYYFVLKNKFGSKWIKKFLEGVREELCNKVEYKKKQNYEKEKKEKLDVIEIDSTNYITKLRVTNKMRLLVNQVVRYLDTKDNFETVRTYCNLKDNLPDISFWKLFHLAHVITPCNNYYSYHQPFSSCMSKIDSDLNSVCKILQTSNSSILEATSGNLSQYINDNVCIKLRDLYEQSNFNEIKDIINGDELYLKSFFRCKNNKGCKWLTLNKSYHCEVLEDGNVKLINDDFTTKIYKANRFKKIN